ncbi:1-phosphofructokinase [Yimella sp. cx-51]|uniref:1-phosphofructokinase n=1 Tax=Yimella sp. cx-51 TaxID=2770551 RepID=UPI00165DC933|nr:1-phosphofructokinase [Yimella sp. cx-51]MBC9955676.1 1-phosphofructokinase [Yimella sp. cx-51]QTH37753.1 1-phosphofructokinase [Yimella sp. cx-51]
MIITLTPNPSIDRTIAFDTLRLGEVQRATSSRIDPGGKGINVSRALAANDTDTLAVLPAGGPEGHLLTELLTAAHVPYRAVEIAGAARMNIAAVEPDGTTTKLNEAGPRLSDGEVSALFGAAAEAAGGAQWVVGCGSLPPGAPIDLYAELIRRVGPQGARVAIDSSGEPFTRAVAAHPHLIKPNHEELAELVGRELVTLGDVVDAARSLVAEGIETVVVSLGADGAIAVTADDLVWAGAKVTDPLSTVGAGDCLLAGFLHGLVRGGDLEAALISGVRWGAAAVRLPGSQVPGPADLEGIDVRSHRSPDLQLVIS